MYSSIKNNITLIGHVGRNPEVHRFENGNMKASFSLATTDYYKDRDGQRQQKTQWHNIIVFGKTADLVAQLLERGSHVALSGKLEYRDYEDKEGVKRRISEINMAQFSKLDRTPTAEVQDGGYSRPVTQTQTGTNPPKTQGGGKDDDLPF